MGSQGRPSIKSGTRSSVKTGVSLQPDDVTDVRKALKSKSASEAGAILANYLIKGTGVDLLVAVCQTAVYVIEKLKRYDELVQKYGEEEAQRRISIEIGVEVVKKLTTDFLVQYAAGQIIKDDNLPPQIKDRVQEITEDVLTMGIEKIEQQFLEE